MQANVNTMLVTLTHGKSWANTQGQAILEVRGNGQGASVFRKTESPVLSLGLQDLPLLTKRINQKY